MNALSKNQWRHWTGEQIQVLMNKIPICKLPYIQNYIWLNWKNPDLLPINYIKNFTAGQWDRILK